MKKQSETANRSGHELTEAVKASRSTLAFVKQAIGSRKCRVDFAFFAPAFNAAEVLSAELEKFTDYDIRIGEDVEERGKYWVEATTQPLTLSNEAMDQTVTQMFNHAKKSGCEFDGWGTLAPVN